MLPWLLAIFVTKGTGPLFTNRANSASPARQYETFLHVRASVLSHGTFLASVLIDASNHAKSEERGRDFIFKPRLTMHSTRLFPSRKSHVLFGISQKVTQTL